MYFHAGNILVASPHLNIERLNNTGYNHFGQYCLYMWQLLCE